MAPHRGVSLTQIHPSPGADTETDIDIIAIHGLDTKSPDTWIWKSKSPGEDVNWLASPHMLPGRVGRARVFTCDWPADLFEQPHLIQKTVKVFARLLLARIKRRSLPKSRHKNKKDRPIVFIASCLRGIILMKALLIADHPPSEYTAIRRSTRGIVFLATPFRGTSFQNVANWAEPGLRAWAFIRGQKVSNLLDSVKGSAFHLEELVRGFTRLCQDKDYPCQVTTFYETGMTSLHRKFPLSWLIPPPLIDLFCQPKPLVDSSSATLDIVPHPLPLDRCHVMMNKFKGPEDPDYKDVVGNIEEILQTIRTNSVLDDADAWIQNKHYTADRLKIECLSGDQLSMDQCYINLAVVEQCGQKKGYSTRWDGMSSPHSIFHRQKVEIPNKTIQVNLAAIFRQRTGRDGNPIQPRRILIRGRAGVGKTTLCKKIVHEFIHGTWSEWNNLFDRVLWVPLRNLKLEERCRQPGYNFEQLFAHEFFSLSSNKSKFASELLSELETNSSKTLFLLDGLDEVSQDLSEGSMSEFLKELLKQPNIIVTSRPSGKMPPDMDLELETIGFYPDQVNDYITKVFTNPKTAKIDMDTVDKIQSFLQNHWLIQGLVRIPIQLDALCYSWKDIPNDMPETMTALYRAIELSLWKKDILRLNKRHHQNPVTAGHIQDADQQEVEEFIKDEIFFLETLAFTGLYDDIIEFERKHLNCVSKTIPGFLVNKTAPFLSFLRISNPSSNNRNGSYHFIHLTFQEYFAARYFVRKWVAGEPLNCVTFGGNGKIDETEPVKFFQKHKYTARYDILWRFVVGLLNTDREESPQKIEDFFQTIEEEPLDLLGPTHQRLVMHCLSEVSVNLPIRVELEQRLSKWLLFECEFGQNNRPHLASEVEFPEQALATAFREGSDKIKTQILWSLRNWTTFPASILEQVVSWLEHDESLPWDAIQAIGRCALPEKTIVSVAARLKHGDMHVLKAAVEILRQQALPDEILKDIAAGLKDKDKDIRKAAVIILRWRALPNEILNDIAAGLKDKDEFIRKAAVEVLGPQVLPEEIRKDLTAGLKDKDRYFREAAVRVLCQHALSNELLNDIAAGLKDKDEFIRQTTVISLGFQGTLPDVILEDIAAQLNDETVHIRYNSIRALSRQKALPYEILEAVVARFNDDDESVRAAAVGVLGQIGQQTALPHEILEAMVKQLRNKKGYVREATMRSLTYQATLPDEVLKAIVMRLNDTYETVQEDAVKALGQQTALSYEIIKAVAALLNDNDESVRAAAVRVLGQIGQQTALPHEILEVMVNQLRDKKGYVREATILSLTYQATLPDEVLKAIAVRLNDADRSVQKAAVGALGQQTALSYEIIKAVAALLSNDDESVRWAAVVVLGRQTTLPDDILEVLAVRLNDKAMFISRAVQSVLRRHKEFYCTLLRGSYVTPIYDILLRRSFQEQLSWYIDDRCSCINFPEGIIKAPVDDHDDFRARIKKAQSVFFP